MSEIQKEAHSWTWAILLYTVVVCFAMIAMITPAVAYMEEYTFTETSSTSSPQTKAGTEAALGTLQQNHFYVNYDTIGNPYSFTQYMDSVSLVSPDKSGTFTLMIGNDFVASGTYQYANGTFSGGWDNYIYLRFTNWNMSQTRTGITRTNITFSDPPGIYFINYSYYDNTLMGGVGTCNYMGYGKVVGANNYPLKSQSYYVSTTAAEAEFVMYNMTPMDKPYPQINYTVTQTGNVAQKFYIYNDTATSPFYTGVQVTNGDDYVVTVNAANISLQWWVVGTGGNYTSTTYFPRYTSPVSPTPTPLPSGTIRTYFQCVDGGTNGAVHGCDIQIHDTTTGVWANSSDDSDGTHYIDTPSTSTLSGYGSATGFNAASRLSVPAKDTVYELIMWDDYNLGAPGSGDPGDPGAGNINLIVIVNDKDTQESLDATVSVTIPSGATTGGSTGTSGSELFIVPNESVVKVTASKTGYTKASKTITTSAFGPDTIRLELSKAVVTQTPVVTYTNVYGTVVTTVDTRSSDQKAQDMMDTVADAGPGLIDLGLAVVAMSLVAMLIGTMWKMAPKR